MQIPPNPSSPQPAGTFTSSSNQPQKGREGGLRSVLSTIALLLIAPLIAIFLVTFVFQSYEVDGQSMETTLQNGDRLIVLKLPRTMAKLSRHAYTPHRGDIIIFNLHPSQDSGGEERQLIKRVIGLPGEHITMDEEGKITITNSDHPHGFSPDQTMAYGAVIKPSPGDRKIDYTIPEGQIFVCGDNRNNSRDSRYFGPISTSDVVGKLGLRIYPFNKTQSF